MSLFARWRQPRLVEITLIVDGGVLWRGIVDPRDSRPINIESTRPVVEGARKFTVIAREPEGSER